MVANEKQTASLQLQCLNSGPAHHGLGVGHEDDTLVAEGVAEVCQANPSVARSPLNYCPPWSDQTCTHRFAWHINLHVHSLTVGPGDNYIYELRYSPKPRVFTGVNVQGSPLKFTISCVKHMRSSCGMCVGSCLRMHVGMDVQCP